MNELRKDVKELLWNEFNYSTYRSLEDEAFDKLCKKVARDIVNKCGEKLQQQSNDGEVRICTGCGRLTTDIALPLTALSCCPDSRYVSIEKFRDEWREENKKRYDKMQSTPKPTGVSKDVAKQYAEFCVLCDRDNLPLLDLDSFIKQSQSQPKQGECCDNPNIQVGRRSRKEYCINCNTLLPQSPESEKGYEG